MMKEGGGRRGVGRWTKGEGEEEEKEEEEEEAEKEKYMYIVYVPIQPERAVFHPLTQKLYSSQ